MRSDTWLAVQSAISKAHAALVTGSAAPKGRRAAVKTQAAASPPTTLTLTEPNKAAICSAAMRFRVKL